MKVRLFLRAISQINKGIAKNTLRRKPEGSIHRDAEGYSHEHPNTRTANN